MAVSFFGLYYQRASKRLSSDLIKNLELAEWATGEVNKAKAEYKLESIKDSYNNQGISAEEY